MNEEQRRLILEFLKWVRESGCDAVLIDCNEGSTFPSERFGDLADQFAAGRSEEIHRSIPMNLRCPNCGLQHIDEGEWATRPHKKHLCVGNGVRAGCGWMWTPSDQYTVGVWPRVL